LSKLFEFNGSAFLSIQLHLQRMENRTKRLKGGL
jgi:hypothetical protein